MLALALLVALKIWVQEGAYRAATEEAIVAAYRAPAAEACARASGSATVSADGGALGWAASPTSRVSVGNPAIPVRLWQVEHEQWHARFRQLYVILGGGPSGLSCTYDLSAGKAEVSRS